MKKVSFFASEILTLVLMWALSFYLMEHLGIRPAGASMSIVIKDVLCVLFLAIVLYAYVDKQIWEAIERFDEDKRREKREEKQLQI